MTDLRKQAEELESSLWHDGMYGGFNHPASIEFRISAIEEALKHAQEAERERCAMVCLDLMRANDDREDRAIPTAFACAAQAIRQQAIKQNEG